MLTRNPRPLDDALLRRGREIELRYRLGWCDIDVMVVSDRVTYADVFGALEPVSAKLGRPVNPTVYTRRDLAKRIKEGNAFVTRVLAQPKVWLIGTEDDLPA